MKKQTVCISDAHSPDQRDPSVNWTEVQSDMKAITVVPMRTETEVLGTIHFERNDKQTPSDTEQTLMERFAGQLAFILQQAQRIVLLQGALDAIDDTVQIIRPDNTILFLNSKLAVERKLKRGWQSEQIIYDPQNAYEWATRPLEPLTFPASPPDGNSLAHQYLTNGVSGEPRAYDIQRAMIYDFRTKLRSPFGADGRIGLVEMAHDLTGLYRVLKDVERWLNILNPRVLAQQILRTYENQHFQWGRIYIIRRSDNTEILESFEQFGLRESEHQKQFVTGKIQFQSGEDKFPWHVLTDAKRTSLYRINSQLSNNFISATATPDLNGLPCYECGQAVMPEALERKPEDREWIEAPLMVGATIVGALSLSKPPPHFRSADWERLRLSVQNAALVLWRALEANKHSALSV